MTSRPLAMPYADLLGVTIENLSPDQVDGSLAWSKDLCTIDQVMHGGALMSLADALGGTCAFLNLPDGAMTSTIESKTNFMRAVRSGQVVARSSPLHVGRSTIVVQTECRDADGRLVAYTVQTQAVIAP